MNMKKALSLIVALVLWLFTLPTNAYAASGLSETDAKAYENVINNKTVSGITDVNSYTTDFDGDGRNELFLIWLTGTDSELVFLWNYRYEVWQGTQRLTEGSFGYMQNYALCTDWLGRSRLVFSVNDDGMEENITYAEGCIRDGKWVWDLYNLHTPVDIMHPDHVYPTEYKGPNGPISQAEFESNIARINSYREIRTFSVLEFQAQPDAPRFFHSAWNEITKAIDPTAFSWAGETPSFDGTYWALSMGATIGSTYYLRMHMDGTYDSISGSLMTGNGSYHWENDRLYIKGTYLRWNGREFHAEQDEQLWNGWPNGGFYVTLMPDSGRTYAKLTNQSTDIPRENPTIGVRVNGTAVRWTDVQPFIDNNDRTMVPLRAVAEALGLEVQWDNATRTASFLGTVTDENLTRYQVRVDFQIGSTSANVTYQHLSGSPSTSETIRMDTVPVIVNDRTFAPIRYLAEAFGYTVSWNGALRQVELYSGTIVKPNFPSVSLADGTYQALVRLDGLIRNADGTETAEFEIRDFILFSDAEIRSLSVGQTLSTPIGDLYVNSLTWVSNDNLSLNSTDSLERGKITNERSMWALCTGGLPIRYTTQYAQMRITSETDIYDNYTFPMTGNGTVHMRRNSLGDIFDACSGLMNSIDVSLTVIGGKATEITIWYRP